MNEYKPPFKFTKKIFQSCMDISNDLGKVSTFKNLSKFPRLRKQNRVKSIFSSCAIEANSLSLEQVHDIINGIDVVGPENEILEIKNAIKAYEYLEEFNPFSLDDLLKAHGILTDGLISRPGKFRLNNEGVYNGSKCIFMAPPKDLVPELMLNLFNWMNQNKAELDLLILSCIFHYEFVYIHPFQDGNGRTARLWQTAILGQYNSIFYWLPIENYIQQYQEDYYEVIDKCNYEGESTLFIEFMLDIIHKALLKIEKQIDSETTKYDISVSKLIKIMEYDTFYTAKELMEMLGLNSLSGFKKRYIVPALKEGAIDYEFPERPSSRNQRYIKKSF